MIKRRPIAHLLTSAAAGVVGVAAFAGVALADPPGRVGRVAYTEGGVSMLPPQAEDWTWASRNYPVAPGESFWTGDDGRARLQIGSVDTRLDSETELDILDLDYGRMRLGLAQGSVDIRLWASPRGGVTISTPAGDVRLDGQGLYRIDVGPPPRDGSYPLVEVTTFDGQAEAPSPEGLRPLYAGQAAILYAGYDPEYQDAQDAYIDDWAQGLEARSRWRPADLDAAAITGLSDLDGAGDYVDDPQFGRVWFPRNVPADWAPYRYGHWAYVEPWGYTWIDDQPWGFAPFHYGRWAQFGGRWGWIPGRRTAEPVYAPALVAFVGGGGWSLGGGEAIGWVPLGPDEVYRPTYRVSDDYWRHVNAASVRPEIVNTFNIHVDIGGGPRVEYRNAPAVTVVRAAAFSGAQPVHAAAIPVTAAVLAQAPRGGPATPPPPSAAARMGSARPTGGAPPVAARRPPVALQAVRAAVIAAPTSGGRPPVIAGARIAAAPPRPAATPPMIAPAQIRNPAAQGARPAPVRPGAVVPPRPTPQRPPQPGAAPPAARPPRPIGAPPAPGTQSPPLQREDQGRGPGARAPEPQNRPAPLPAAPPPSAVFQQPVRPPSRPAPPPAAPREAPPREAPPREAQPREAQPRDVAPPPLPVRPAPPPSRPSAPDGRTPEMARPALPPPPARPPEARPPAAKPPAPKPDDKTRREERRPDEARPSQP